MDRVSPPCLICRYRGWATRTETSTPAANVYARRQFLLPKRHGLPALTIAAPFGASQVKPDRSRGEPFKGAEAQQIDKLYLGDIYYCSMPSPAYRGFDLLSLQPDWFCLAELL